MLTLNAVIHTYTNDAECSSRSNSAFVPENTKKFHKLILADCKLKLHEITEELKISEGNVFTILNKDLSMRKLCSKCSQSTKNNNASTIQCIVFNCFNATKTSFCINMCQWMKHGSTTSLRIQISSQLSGQ